MSIKHSKISRRKFMACGALALAGGTTLPGSSPSPNGAASISFTKHQVKEKKEGCLRVAACQILNYPDVGKSTRKVLEWIASAAKDDVDVIVFPEACLCAYDGDAYWRSAQPEAFEEAEVRVIEASKRFNIAVILGTVHWETDRIYNDLLVIDKGGVVRGRCCKTHLAEAWPVPGKHLPVYDVAGVKSCFIICHDVRYPELVRLPAIAGAQICYFSSHESGLKHEHKLSA